MDKQLEALEALKANLIANNRSVKDIAEVNNIILKRKAELIQPCPVIYVDFKNKHIIKRVA